MRALVTQILQCRALKHQIVLIPNDLPPRAASTCCGNWKLRPAQDGVMSKKARSNAGVEACRQQLKSERSDGKGPKCSVAIQTKL